MLNVDVIGGLIDWLKERDSSFKFERRTMQFAHGSYPNSWFNVRSSHGKLLGQIALIFPGEVPPGLQYDFPDSDDFGFLYCRKEWRKLYNAEIFDDVLETARSLRDGKPVAWHKFFRYKETLDETIHRVRDASWPPKFM